MTTTKNEIPEKPKKETEIPGVDLFEERIEETKETRAERPLGHNGVVVEDVLPEELEGSEEYGKTKSEAQKLLEEKPRTTLLTQGWTEYLRKNTDMPELFIKTLRFCYLSNTIGRFYSLGSTDERTRLNTFIILASPAGLYFRSASANALRVFLRCTLRKYTELLTDNEEKQRELRKNEYASCSVPGGSCEGIADYIEPLVETVESFLTLEHEIGLILQGVFKEGNKNIIELYINLYDGHEYHKTYSTRTNLKSFRCIPEGTYFNLLGVMQDSENYLTKGMSSSGFVRRLIIAQTPVGNPKRRSPLFKENPLSLENDFQELAVPIGEEMAATRLERDKLESEGQISLFFKKDALAFINQITDQCIEEGRKSPDNPYLLFKGSHGLKVGKLAGLISIDKHGWKAKWIELEDVREANAFLEEINSNLKTVLEHSVLNDEDKRIEKWIWQAKGVIYRYYKKHGKPMPLLEFQKSFCGGYKCRNPNWARVKEALLTQEEDIEYDIDHEIKYIGTEGAMRENGINV